MNKGRAFAQSANGRSIFREAALKREAAKRAAGAAKAGPKSLKLPLELVERRRAVMSQVNMARLLRRTKSPVCAAERQRSPCSFIDSYRAIVERHERARGAVSTMAEAALAAWPTVVRSRGRAGTCGDVL